MEKTYTTGQFARLAHTTPRTLRFYDQKGLLKPSYVQKNGYRRYTEKDLLVLQKILLFKSLGFSLEGISYLLMEDSRDLVSSLKLQSHLVTERIDHLKALKEALIVAARTMEKSEDGKDRILDLLEILDQDDQLLEQYKNAKNLQVRIDLHKRYSLNQMDWFDWIYSQIDFSKINRLLEVGCGSGQLWLNRPVNLRHREVFLSDISEGMIADAKKKLNNDDFSFMVFSAENIPFRSGYFDAVAANHVLFYLKDVSQGIGEIARVLNDHGILYASAYGKQHMHEISDLAGEFDPSIKLSSTPLYDNFGIENGKKYLQKYFSDVKFHYFQDVLHVDQARDLADYILSCHGNQNEKLIGRYNEFLDFLEKKIEEKGYIEITKDVGIFIAKK